MSSALELPATALLQNTWKCTVLATRLTRLTRLQFVFAAEHLEMHGFSNTFDTSANFICCRTPGNARFKQHV